ncbi:Ferredoxin-NADP reductase [Glycomyces harbinensis]|uniref:Ferredoxin-NADP reductase n=2 Tax=Glycomyces harbinensis TaxID=58114 RepID=A0A1G6V4E2_9ACTN|nr:ferredoxin reductase [Glycomyces harbinensis]SDD48333.1 Ferredoxin-NADP reductase [Glycomyces harbinensis]
MWQKARLVERLVETESATTLVFEPETWDGHVAGQHADIRLTADDGYQAVRSYSLAAPLEGGRIAFTIQRVHGGESSTYLCDDLPVGAYAEVRGPVGGWFVWRGNETRPVLLLAGGSGIVPLQAMVRQRRALGSRVPFRLLYSVRTPEDVIYADELIRPPRGDDGVETVLLFTRETLAGSRRPPERIGLADLTAHGWPADFEPDCFICGPNGFVEAAAKLLIALGHDSHRIKTERFG